MEVKEYESNCSLKVIDVLKLFFKSYITISLIKK